MDAASLSALVQRRAPLYDKDREGHYNLISALHKSLRGSDPDAALYWFCRMLAGGEDPLYIARRLVRFAVEDIGLADPQALVLAIAARDAYDCLGSPEGELALAQCVIYLAAAPKSNAAYTAYGAAMRLAKEGGSLTPPEAHPERADQADAATGLRRGLCLRPQHRGRRSPARTISRTAWSGSNFTVPGAAATRQKSKPGSKAGPKFAGKRQNSSLPAANKLRWLSARRTRRSKSLKIALFLSSTES